MTSASKPTLAPSARRTRRPGTSSAAHGNRLERDHAIHWADVYAASRGLAHPAAGVAGSF
ncbi:hypothetical protein ACWDGI_10030 [Streptomyces sp. NPDC001220]